MPQLLQRKTYLDRRQVGKLSVSQALRHQKYTDRESNNGISGQLINIRYGLLSNAGNSKQIISKGLLEYHAFWIVASNP